MADAWVKVKDESELRAGMTVELRTCYGCGRRERLILLRFDGSVKPIALRDGSLCGESTGWFVAGSCYQNNSTSLSDAIREGRLYRLADDQLTDVNETADKELVRT